MIGLVLFLSVLFLICVCSILFDDDTDIDGDMEG